MKCSYAEILLVDYLENELGPDLAGRLEAHLEDCSACRAELAGLQEPRETLRCAAQAELPEPPEKFWQENLRAVACATWEKSAPGGSPRETLFSRSTAGILAAAAVLIIALVWSLKWRTGNLESPAAAVPVAAVSEIPQSAYADSLYQIAEAIYQLDLAAMALESANELGPDSKPADLTSGTLFPAERSVYDGLADLKEDQFQEVMLVLASN